MARVEAVHPVLGCRDVERAAAFYARLGFRLVFQDDPAAPRYAAVVRDRAELHLQWQDAEAWNHPGDRPVYRFVVDDPDALWTEYRAAGALTDATSVRDTPWGTREFHLRDPDGNGLQFYRAG